MSDLSLRPGISLGSYPQRREDSIDELEASLRAWSERQRKRLGRRIHGQKTLALRVGQYDKALQECSDEQLQAVVRELRVQLHRSGLTEPLLVEAFAVIREAASRTLGMRHFDEQLYGGWLIMNGMLAEMQTGEGKTLTTTLPACTAALAGIPVHVITANDYLAERDCELMRPLYHRLGLSAAATLDGMTPDACRQAYRADIVHTTNKQVAFDYLRDRIEMGDDTGDLRFEYRRIRSRQNGNVKDKLLLRGLCFAIVDEADSVLIDEANTPLIITRTVPNDDSNDTYGDALYLAASLEEDRDFRVDAKSRQIELTVAGEDRLEEQVSSLPKLWRNPRKREMLVKQALAATYFYLRDRDYVVVDEKVQIVDPSSGRVMADRSWEQGLHQMIEAREGCVISERREPQARISYQRFFSRYLRLGGTSGTLAEVATELRHVYGLEVRKVAPHRPSKRVMQGEQLFASQADKQQALLDRVAGLQRQGRPVLIGTCSVEESEQVSAWLQQHDLAHRVLNARQDRDEAEIIAAAGSAGAITVATNMAGRGTDIGLGAGVEALGGLHVISFALNDSRRVDRQLYGRAARQGDPGSGEAILSLQDDALPRFYGQGLLRLCTALTRPGKPLPAWLGRLLLRLPQRRYETRQRRVRKALTRQDKRLQRILAFSGRFE